MSRIQLLWTHFQGLVMMVMINSVRGDDDIVGSDDDGERVLDVVTRLFPGENG